MSSPKTLFMLGAATAERPLDSLRLALNRVEPVLDPA